MSAAATKNIGLHFIIIRAVVLANCKQIRFFCVFGVRLFGTHHKNTYFAEENNTIHQYFNLNNLLFLYKIGRCFYCKKWDKIMPVGWFFPASHFL
jgi:hypothetical protein